VNSQLTHILVSALNYFCIIRRQRIWGSVLGYGLDLTRNLGSIPGKNKKFVFRSYQTGLGDPQDLTREFFEGVRLQKYKANQSVPMYCRG